MTLKLTHIGEELVSRMLNRLASQGRLSEVRCAVSAAAITNDLSCESPRFVADAVRLRVEIGGRRYNCDGAQALDIACVGGDVAVAMEAKLGITRMSQGAFRSRFIGDCGFTDHSAPRIRGSMISVLERRLPGRPAKLIGVNDSENWTIAKIWWLVVRSSVWERWCHQPPLENARILVFESLAGVYGDRSDFDKLVLEIVGEHFAERWGVLEYG